MILLIVVTAALATACAVGVVGVLFGRREGKLERRLIGYERVDESVSSGDVSTSSVQSAVDLTGRLAERTGLLAKVEQALEQGDVPIRAPELIFYTVAGTIILFLLISLVAGLIWGVLAAAIAVIVPILYVTSQKAKRHAAFERQLPATLTLLASSLRAGFSFMQGLEAVAQEIGEPMRGELQRVFTEVRLGRAPEDALADAADRMGSVDLGWTVMAIKIQREVGGNLAVLLDTVADTMQKRERIRREIKALTAEGRMSAVVLALAPLAMAVGLYLLAPDYVETLFNHVVGVIAVCGAVVAAIVGYFWLRKIVDIEV